MTKPFIRKGQVYADGALVFTATRDLFAGDVCQTGDIVRPDGSHPANGERMTDTEAKIMMGEAEFTQ